MSYNKHSASLLATDYEVCCKLMSNLDMSDKSSCIDFETESVYHSLLDLSNESSGLKSQRQEVVKSLNCEREVTKSPNVSINVEQSVVEISDVPKPKISQNEHSVEQYCIPSHIASYISVPTTKPEIPQNEHSIEQYCIPSHIASDISISTTKPEISQNEHSIEQYCIPSHIASDVSISTTSEDKVTSVSVCDLENQTGLDDCFVLLDKIDCESMQNLPEPISESHDQISTLGKFQRQQQMYLQTLEAELHVQSTELERERETLQIQYDAVKNTEVIFSKNCNVSGYTFGIPYFRTKTSRCPYNDDTRDRSDRTIALHELPEVPFWSEREKNTLKLCVFKNMVSIMKQIVSTRSKVSNRSQSADVDAEYSEEFKRLQGLPYAEGNLIELYNKMREQGDPLKIDWYDMELNHFYKKHTSEECANMWNFLLKPEWKQCAWSIEENAALKSAVDRHFGQNWAAIASEIPDRSEFQCLVQYQTHLAQRVITQKRWTENNDARLLEIVERYQYGDYISWNDVAYHYEDCTKQQLYMRYISSLQPQRRVGKFSASEDQLILDAVKQHGQFKNIPPGICPGRTNMQIKGRYLTVLQNNSPDSSIMWTEQEDKLIVNLVKEFGTKTWSKIALQITGRNRVTCRHRYAVLKKFMDRNPGADLAAAPRKALKRSPTQKGTVDSNNDNSNSSEISSNIPTKEPQIRTRSKRSVKSKNISTSAREQRAIQRSKRKTDTAAVLNVPPIKKERLSSVCYYTTQRVNDDLLNLVSNHVFLQERNILTDEQVNEVASGSAAVVRLLFGKLELEKINNIATKYTLNEQERKVLNKMITMQPEKRIPAVKVLPCNYETATALRALQSQWRPMSMPQKKFYEQYSENNLNREARERFCNVFQALMQWPFAMNSVKPCSET